MKKILMLLAVVAAISFTACTTEKGNTGDNNGNTEQADTTKAKDGENVDAKANDGEKADADKTEEKNK